MTDEVLLYEKLFYKCLRIRLFEKKVIELYPSDKIQSPVHLSIGQEAVAVGVCEALRREDWVFGSYRSHAFYLAKGGDMKSMMAELYGKATGDCKGKAGSMHLTAPEVGFMGSSAVVASTIPHAAGGAFAAKMLGKDQVVATIFGDGATDEGVYHESLNFAALKKLPVIFVCENNGLAVHSRREDRQAYSILEHAKTYGLAAERIEEGWDFVSVAKKFEKIAERVRKNKEAYFVEMRTYRCKEHVGPGEDFQAGYRSIQECEAWNAKDPLCADKKTLEKLSPMILKEIEEAVAFAEQSKWPGAEELLTDVE
jgi:TPP-dependent pyruvate/acetoin dehydrogenase alpha subunit